MDPTEILVEDLTVAIAGQRPDPGSPYITSVWIEQVARFLVEQGWRKEPGPTPQTR